MSDNPKDVLRGQVEYWEGIAREAREQLRIAEAVLPGLRESLAHIEKVEQQGASIPPVLAPTTPVSRPLTPLREEPSLPDAGEPEAETPRPDQKELRSSEEISRAIHSYLSELPGRFLQNDVVSALDRHGLFVNRSTLRGNLQRLADKGNIIRIAEPGRGRRATIFAKL